MPKQAKQITALALKNLTEPGKHFVGGAPGLTLQIAPSGTKSWILRYNVGDKRREMGLGSYPEIELKDARDKALKARALLKDGNDPILERDKARTEMIRLKAKNITFKQAAQKYLEEHKSAWKNAKHAAQWVSTLEDYAYDHIGSMYVSDIDRDHVLAVLKPIWKEKTETASRLRGRIEKVLGWAKANRHRDGENPATWKGNLDANLTMPGKVAKRGHHAALPFAMVGEFMQELRASSGTGARALEFAILTASRSGEVRGATWSEINLIEKYWTIPGDRMKAGKEHRVPLSPQALRLLDDAPRLAETEFIFPGPSGKALSDMTLTATIRRLNEADESPKWIDPVNRRPITAHGFRSTFRDWAGETTAYPREVIEHALAHLLKDKAEAAYARGTQFDKRRQLMAEWAQFCDKIAGPASADVIPIGAARQAAA